MKFFEAAALASVVSSSVLAPRGMQNVTNVNVNVQVNVQVSLITLACCAACHPITTTIYSVSHCPVPTTITMFDFVYIVTTPGYVTFTCPYTVKPGMTTTVTACHACAPATVCKICPATVTPMVVYQAVPATKTTTVTEMKVTAAPCYTCQAVVVETPASVCPTVTVTKTVTATSCATCVPSQTIFPSFILPIKYGMVGPTSFFASVGNGNSTIVTYNINSNSGRCNFELLLPPKSQLRTSDYTITGSSVTIQACMLDSPVTGPMDARMVPSSSRCFTKTAMEGQGTIHFGSFACKSGQTSFELAASSGALTLFEDYNPAALGYVITLC